MTNRARCGTSCRQCAVLNVGVFSAREVGDRLLYGSPVHTGGFVLEGQPPKVMDHLEVLDFSLAQHHQVEGRRLNPPSGSRFPHDSAKLLRDQVAHQAVQYSQALL